MNQVIDMDTDEDESEIDDGEEERRIRRYHRHTVNVPVRQGIVPTKDTNQNLDIEKTKKQTIQIKLPQTIIQSRV